jgi:peptidoglycan/xylan/chitin deacetylase (PgdA/CDA1 family)
MGPSLEDFEARSAARARARAARVRRRRIVAVGVLGLAVAGVVAALASGGGGGGGDTGRAATRTATPGGAHHTSTVAAGGTGVPGHAVAPILMYHVIAAPPAGAPFPGLYVTPSEFAAQMQALKAAGWHAVTMDQLGANWSRGVPLGPGRPIVISFDNGYRSQYTKALPVLARLGWVGVENIQLTGLPPSQGGLSRAQVRALVAAGWELDTQGRSHADLIKLSGAALAREVVAPRRTLQRRYGVPVNWFCYPSGHYDATVIAEVKSAGYAGSTTVVPGWARTANDPYRLPRLRVLGSTGPAELLAEIAAIRGDPVPPPSYSG